VAGIVLGSDADVHDGTEALEYNGRSAKWCMCVFGSPRVSVGVLAKAAYL
jgi:hypothetical protein